MNKYTIYVLTYSELELSVLDVNNNYDLELTHVVNTIVNRENKLYELEETINDLIVCTTTKSSCMNRIIEDYEEDFVDNELTLSMIKDDVIMTVTMTGDERDMYFITHVND